MFCSPEEDRGCAIPALANQLRWLGTGHAGRLQPGEGLLKPLCVGLCCSAHVPSLLCDTVGLSLWSASFLGDAGAGGAWETALLVGTDSKAVCTGGGCRVWIVTGCNWWRGVSLKSNWDLILPFFRKDLVIPQHIAVISILFIAVQDLVGEDNLDMTWQEASRIQEKMDLEREERWLLQLFFGSSLGLEVDSRSGMTAAKKEEADLSAGQCH